LVAVLGFVGRGGPARVFLWLGAITCVVVGAASAFVGLDLGVARVLLIVGIGYAVLLLLVDRFPRR
jgi:hypothetical protein